MIVFWICFSILFVIFAVCSAWLVYEDNQFKRSLVSMANYKSISDKLTDRPLIYKQLTNRPMSKLIMPEFKDISDDEIKKCCYDEDNIDSILSFLKSRNKSYNATLMSIGEIKRSTLELCHKLNTNGCPEGVSQLDHDILVDYWERRYNIYQQQAEVIYEEIQYLQRIQDRIKIQQRSK